MTMPLPDGVADHVRSAALDGPQALKRQWFHDRGGIIVAVEELLGFGGREGESLIETARDLGASELWGLFTESEMNTMLKEPDGYSIPLTHEAVDEWTRPRGMFDLMVITPDLSFAVLEANDEFGLVGGPRKAVEEFLGTSIEQARRDFAEYADDMRSASSHLPGIARLYSGG